MSLNTKSNNIDDEWSSFLTNPSAFDEYYDDINAFDNNDNNSSGQQNSGIIYEGDAPEPTEIYISTKSKIAYLEQPIDLKLFWNIPVIPYHIPKNGVIKKQIKINSKTKEELEEIQERLQSEPYFEEHIMTHIDNPNGRIKFKDIRKITVGISKKDIMSYRSKKKQAFYNCFVMILRIKFDDTFKEFHIKVFNTGKLEIPGVQNDSMYETVLQTIVNVLQPFHEYTLMYKQISDTVLINSNFNCGFFVNREALFDILRNKYSVPAIYDPCSYPGIQCKFYFDKATQVQTNGLNKDENLVEVSFMIFRTGSVLIVGMCDEYVLDKVYEFLTNILKTEFKFICQKLIDINELEKDKKKKQRKKIINIMTGVDEDIANEINAKIKESITQEQNLKPVKSNGKIIEQNIINANSNQLNNEKQKDEKQKDEKQKDEKQKEVLNEIEEIIVEKKKTKRTNKNNVNEIKLNVGIKEKITKTKKHVAQNIEFDIAE